MKDSEFISFAMFVDNLIHHTQNDLESGLYEACADDLDLIHRVLNGGFLSEKENETEC